MMSMEDEVIKYRKPEYPIDPMLLSRWSPRAMTGESIDEEELFTLFEAARWAPSAYNNQPWFFLYATRDSKHWSLFFDLLVEFNQSWCKDAAALVVVLSKKVIDGRPHPTHSFDTGASWQNIALEGACQGLVIHGMSGFDYDKAKKVLNVPENHKIEAMFAVGRRGETSALPKELQDREKPSDRKKIKEFIKQGPL